MDNEHTLLASARLAPKQLRKTIDAADLPFTTTKEVPILTNIVGHERGRKVMQFGLSIKKDGYHLYVSGPSGTGRTTYTHTLLKDIANKKVPLYDWCYVFNFHNSSAPQALKLPTGMGKQLKKDMEVLLENLQVDIPRAFNEESYQRTKSLIMREFKASTDLILQAINKIARQHQFMISQSNSGSLVTIPMINDQPISEEAYRELSDEQLDAIETQAEKLQDKIYQYSNQLRDIEKEMNHQMEQLEEKTALQAIHYHIKALKEAYQSCIDVVYYFEQVEADILTYLPIFLVKEESEGPIKPAEITRKREAVLGRYAVNLLVDNSETKGAPVITADNPTYYNLIGKVEYENRMGMMSTNFMKIKPGFLHYANGGYLIIQAKDIFTKNFAWEGLKRALLNKQLKIENIGEQAGLVVTSSINPGFITLDVKVVIIGHVDLYQLLYQYDEDFSKLFKIKVDFDVEMEANLDNMMKLASFIHRHCQSHDLLHFDASAVAKIVEYSTRLAGNQKKMSTRFNQQVEIIYEADTWAKMAGSTYVTEMYVKKAIRERNYRNSLYEEKMKESMIDGSILIDTTGAEIGQVNGLAVYDVGQYQFGKPSKITATTFLGQKGIINIERESKLSGKIHNKGIYILAGYLGEKFAQKHPLAVTAHLAFEQSYGGVDGDSASSTELYALLSSLSGVPIKQSFAVTGSVNQKGHIQPIGGVNEKIEGFFALCKARGLTGEQGVLIPVQNVPNLMLNDEVVEAVAEGKFHILQIETIEEGIEILTGEPAIIYTKDNMYDRSSIYGKVAAKLESYAELGLGPE